MANILNDRDITLSNTAVRLVNVPSNYIELYSDIASFTVTNGVPNLTDARITAVLRGQLIGTPTITIVSGASTITQQILDGNRVAFLNYFNLTADEAILRASLTYLGVTYTTDISIGGQTLRPSVPTGLARSVYGADIKLVWNKNIDADIAGYEVRTADTNWGTNNAYVFRGATNSCLIPPSSINTSTTWYIRAFDTSGLYSATSASTSYTTDAPPNITDLKYEYADTSLTNATITLRWDPVAPPFGLREYQITYYSESLAQNVTFSVRDNLIILPADWLGNKTFTVKTIDNLGNSSTGYSEPIAKLPPNPVTNLKAQIIDNNVQLSWTLPAKTSLPIAHALIKRGTSNSTWNTATVVGTKAGEFTTLQELVKGNYVYWVAAVDTDNNESTPEFIPATVQQAADFTFNKEFNSTFTGTKVNAVVESSALVFPVNTTETWAQHFTNNSWTTPSSQISAKYPVYIQPGTATASYTEIFDYGSGSNLILSSSSITVSLSGTNIIGTTSIGTTIATSADGITYSTPVAGTNIFATNFRFIRVVITATRGTGDGITNLGSVYLLTGINVRLDTKLRTDSGTVTTTVADPDGGGGNYVNFNNEFLDISSINLTAAGTAPRNCVYSFMDEIFTGTYSIVSGVLTATITSGSSSGAITDHKLYPGQKVRLSSASGAVPAQVYTIVTRPSATTFTVATTEPNSSGAIYMYPNSMRVYVFDNSGTRQAQVVSWTVRGS
jgi:hypothetical protein